jgi:hypothetical protein
MNEFSKKMRNKIFEIAKEVVFEVSNHQMRERERKKVKITNHPYVWFSLWNRKRFVLYLWVIARFG